MGASGPNEEESYSISRKMGASVLNRYCHSQVIPNSYWIFLSLEALASEAAPRVELESRTTYRVRGASVEVVSESMQSWIVTQGST